MRGTAAFIIICVAAAAYATGGGAWVGDTWGGRMVKLSPSGSIVRTVGPFTYPYGVAVDPSDGSVWFTVNAQTVVKMTAEGQELFRRSYNTEQISVNPGDGACWIRLHNPRGVARLDKNGTETANESRRSAASVRPVGAPPTPGITPFPLLRAATSRA
jgi:DNA-binding beta-propeller fold protein YncE